MNVKFENDAPRFIDLDVRAGDSTIGRINFETVRPGQMLRSLDGRNVYVKHTDGSIRRAGKKFSKKERKALKAALREGEKRARK